MYTEKEREIPTQSKFAHIPNHMQIFPWTLTNPSFNFLFSTNLSLKYIIIHASQWGDDQFLERSKGKQSKLNHNPFPTVEKRGDSFSDVKLRFPKFSMKKNALRN